MKWYVLVGLICISLKTTDVEHLFMHLFAKWYVFRKIPIPLLHLIFNWVVCPFVELKEFFIYSGYQNLIR